MLNGTGTIIISVAAILCVACGQQQDNKAKGGSVDTTAAQPAAAKTKTIVCFGNSLTAGYGLAGTGEAYPAWIQKKIDSLGLPYTVVNAGVSGETTAGGLSRLDWILKQPLDVFVLELGANDGLRGLPLAETRSNLQAIIDRVKAANPGARIVLAGMQIPPSMGEDYASGFRKIFPELAQANNISLIPFFLEGVGGEKVLNQEDGIHPNLEGTRRVAQNVWKVLQPLL